MGRAPCCDKANVKKGPWSPEEDAKLKSYIEQHGTGGNWIALPQKIGLKRCGKSCRLRWLNYLRPNIKHGGFSEEEDNLICSLYMSIGSRWSIIAAQLPGRTDNDIKNYWNTRLKKKLLGKHRKEQRRGIKSENKNVNINQSQSIPYWQEITKQEEHASIRKLLIKLGGRFSEDGDANHEYDRKKSIVDEVQFPPLYHYDDLIGINMDSAAQHQQLGYKYGMDDSHFQMLQQGQSSNYQLDDPVAARFDGLEFLYGDDHSRIGVGSLLGAENMNEMVINPSYVGMIQEASFHDGYPAPASGTRIQ